MRFLKVTSAIVLVMMSATSMAREAIAPMRLSDALSTFARNSGIQVVYVSTIADGLRTKGAPAGLEPDAALRALLDGTGLSYRFINPRTVTIRSSQAEAPADEATPPMSGEDRRAVDGTLRLSLVPEGSTAADEKEAADEQKRGERGVVKEESSANDAESAQLTVTGTRIRGLLGEQSIQPVLTITREQIERYGISSLGEIFRYIPQVSSFELGQEIQSPSLIGTPGIDVTSNRITATLRGAPLGGTLLLVNGRRVPKTGQSGGLQGNDAYNLGGIPLSAVERVDVLLDGASAVYGADAVGGVINVILRKNYRGTEARINYENTFDSDVSVRTVALTHGFSTGKLSALVSASWEEAGSMMWSDRWFLKSFDRSFLGGPNLVSASSYGYSGPGIVSSVSGNLPGLSTNQAPIPAGSTGTNLTVADYANAGPLPEAFDYGDYMRYSSPYERKSVSGSIEYEFSRSATVFAEARWGESRTWSSTTPVVGFNRTVPAGAPGNPFDVPIRVTKWFFDQPAPEQEAVTENRGVTAGIRGEFLQDWRYESAMHEVRSLPDVATRSSSLNTTLLAAAYAGPNPPILLYDSTAGISPNPPGALEALLTEGADAERVRERTFDAQADGPLFSLPAGDVRVSIGMEYRDESVDFPFPGRSLSIHSNNRYTSGLFSEIRLPLVSQRQRWPLVNRLEASLAVRHDRYSDYPEATSPRYGLLYRPFSWLMLRASHGEGYKVPTLVQLYRPSTQGEGSFPPGLFFDAERGGETIDGLITIVFGGNPDLKPERSENRTAGAVIDVPFLEGLSVSLDYYDTRYVDRVGSLGLTDLIVLFPDAVTRGDNLPGDQPGWPGPVIGYDSVAFNIAVNRIAGYDIGAVYHRSGGWGNWTVQATASKTTRNESRAAPTQPVTELPTFNLPVQITGSVFWERGALSLGALCAYREASIGSAATGPSIPSATRWDWQGNYDFGRSGWSAMQGSAWWGRVLADTRVHLTIFNVFDEVPPLRNTSFMPDNSVVDSRLRRYAVSVTRKF